MAFRNVVLFGAGGTRIGHHILHALLDDGTFNVSIIARWSSKTVYPEGVVVRRIDNSFPHDELVRALTGCEVVISTTGFSAQAEQYKLIDAAIEARVRRFFPSEWGMDNADPTCQKLCPIFKQKSEVQAYLRLRQSETFTWTAVATSIWLDWFVSVWTPKVRIIHWQGFVRALDTNFIGIDPSSYAVSYWAGGAHTPSCTTLPYCAAATLALLARPDLGRNQRIFLCPFEASQQSIVSILERTQNVKYQTQMVDDGILIADAQRKWQEEKDVSATYTLIAAGVLHPEYRSDFATASKSPILERMVDMPELTLEGVVKDWIKANPQTVK